MKQSRSMSFVEAIANVIVGYSTAVITQMLVFPWFGLHMPLAQNLKLAMAFTLISIVRSFVLRRVFEAIRIHKAGTRNRRPGRTAASPSGGVQERIL